MKGITTASTHGNFSFYLAIVEWDRIAGGRSEGVRKPMLSWKNKFHKVPCTFQLGLRARIHRFTGVILALWARRVGSIQDIYITNRGERNTSQISRVNVRFLGKQTEITEV